jgi:putative transposase
VRPVTISALCRIAGFTRQGYYQERRQRQRQRRDDEGILEAVRRRRLEQPRVGARKLQEMLKHTGVAVGRDYLFALLGDNGLLVAPRKKKVRTPYYDEALPVYRNLLSRLEPTLPHQVWVADITYIDTDEGYLYLSLVTDRVSRKIVGWNAAANAEAAESIKALRMAIDDLPAGQWPIHHSDRGSQYCCHEYAGVLAEHGISISMTEQNHCYENAHAERVNGILKSEFYLDHKFRSHTQARKAIAQAITTYNARRPHFALQLRTPNQVHALAA